MTELSEETLKVLEYIKVWAIFLLLLIAARKPQLVDEVLNTIVNNIAGVIRRLWKHIKNAWKGKKNGKM